MQGASRSDGWQIEVSDGTCIWFGNSPEPRRGLQSAAHGLARIRHASRRRSATTKRPGDHCSRKACPGRRSRGGAADVLHAPYVTAKGGVGRVSAAHGDGVAACPTLAEVKEWFLRDAPGFQL